MTSSANDDMPAWKRVAQERLARTNPPAETQASTRGGSDRGNPRAQTFTQDELYADAVPDVNPRDDLPEVHKVSDAEVERILDTTPYEQQYRLFGKGDMPQYDAATGEHRMRCPFPSHDDEHPSGSFKVDGNGKDVYNCFKCGGGDIFSIAAAHYGMSTDGGELPYIKRKLAAQLSGAQVENYGGHEVVATPAVREKIEVEQRRANMRLVEDIEELDAALGADPEPEPQPETAQPAPAPVEPPPAAGPNAAQETENLDWVSQPIEMGDNDPEMREFNSGKLDCEAVAKDETFLGEYYKDAIRDLVPKEFHLWNGILALSLAVGRTIEFADSEGKSYPNFYAVFVAKSASGKSRSKEKFKGVVELAMPYDEASPRRSGVKMLPQIGSAESLEKEMQAPLVTLDIDGTVSSGNVKGYWYEDEFSSFYKKATAGNNNSSRLKEVLTTAFSGGSLGSTALNRGTFYAPEPFLCFDSNVQPGVVRNVMSKDDADSGFLNRIIFIGAAHRLTAKEEYSFDQHVVDFDYPAHAARLREINKWCHDTANAQLGPIKFKMEPDVIRAFNHIMRTEFKDITHGEHAENMLARMDLHFRRLCVVMCANEMTDTLTMDIFKRTLHLYWYIKRTSLLIAGKVEDSRSNEDEKYILDTIKGYYLKQVQDGVPPEKRGFTTGQMWKKGMRKVLGNRDVPLEQFKRQVETLADAGLLKEIEPPQENKRKRGRPPGSRYIPVAEQD